MTYYEIIYSGFAGRFLYNTSSIADNAAVYYAVFLALMLVCAVAAYFIGCLNFGIIISNGKYHEDIRTKGSGNAGATNMLRTYGTKTALFTFIGDFLKAAIATALGICVLGGIGGYTAAFACMLGHAFPCFYGFKGGKGVAVSAGAVFILDWRLFLILIAVFALIVWWTRFISLGSVTVFFLFPLLLSRMNEGRMPSIVVLPAFMMAALGIYLHRANIKRIYNGTESKVSFKKKKNEDEDGDGE